jgi:hypothetical protein
MRREVKEVHAGWARGPWTIERLVATSFLAEHQMEALTDHTIRIIQFGSNSDIAT